MYASTILVAIWHHRYELYARFGTGHITQEKLPRTFFGGGQEIWDSLGVFCFLCLQNFLHCCSVASLGVLVVFVRENVSSERCHRLNVTCYDFI